MTDMRTRLKGLGVSEARLAAIGMGAPSTAAPATTTEPVTSIFRQRQAEHEAAKRAPKVTAFTTAQLEHRANAQYVLEKYRAADLATRLKIRTEHGDLLALGREIEAENQENPDPPAAA
jgi:hypothetical protein